MDLNEFFCKDRVCAICTFILAVWVFITASSFPASLMDKIGSGLFPQFIAIVIAIASILLFVTAKPKEEEKASRDGYIALAVVAGDVLFYVLTWQVFGFIISNFLFVFIFVMYFEKRWGLKERIVHALIFSSAFSLFMYLFFAKLLHILLPTLIH